MPRVSICLPCLNGRPFLAERLDTILAQTFQDWELVVMDSYSTDGSWELFGEYAAREPRMRLFQAPREGIYAGINACIEKALGEFVYIATADDTMAPDCLEEMVAALESHPECGLAHCRLQTINEKGTDFDSRWATDSVFARSAPELVDRRHIRKAPFDGLLHLVRASVYWSLTQLLIRHSLFQTIGNFTTRWGSAGDFHWNMQAALLANTIHVPETWAAWRVHSSQATQYRSTSTPAVRAWLQDIIEDALSSGLPRLRKRLRSRLADGWHCYLRDREILQKDLQRQPSRSKRMKVLAKAFVSNRRPALDWLRWKCGRNPNWMATDVDIVRSWMNEETPTAWLVPCD